MGQKAAEAHSGPKRKRRPAISPEARENHMIALAEDLAEQQLMDGTASAQVITHYLKLGSTKERIELERLELEKELVKAKTENLRAQKDMSKMFSDAISAMRSYQGVETGVEDDQDL